MNFLIIVADDLGWHDVGFHGSDIETPNIDHLAYCGARLQNFYSHPMCTPSRAALLTGRFPFRTGTQILYGLNDNRGLSVKELTLSQHLKNNGYSTYLVGKWHLGNRFRFLPTNRGFDYFCGATGGVLDHYTHEWDKLLDFRRNLEPLKFNFPYHSTDVYADETINIIKKHDKFKPFYLQLCFNAPHVPLQSWIFNDWYNKSPIDKNRKIYSAMVTHMDFQIGRIIRALRDNQLYDDTVICFLSDNGGWKGPEFGGNNYPLRGGKLSFYEGGLKVVSLFSHKSLRDNGVLDNVCHMVDIFPTICNLAKIEIPSDLDGKDIFGSAINDHNRDFVYFLVKNENQLVGSIRNGDWKFNKLSDIRVLKNGYDEWYFEPAEMEGSELFNIKDDPFEKQNVILSHPDIVNNLLNKMIDYSKDYLPIVKWKNSNNIECWGSTKNDILMLNEDEIENFDDLYSMSLEKMMNYDI